MPRVVTFGEIMGRLAPPGTLRFRQALPGSLDVTFAGAEANVAASLAMLGIDAAFVTALPKNVIAEACIDRLRGLGVDTRQIVRTDSGRLGLYFLETGANQRPSQVTYDRDGSAISLTPPEAYRWDETFRGAQWFHVTGITPSLSRTAADATLAAVAVAKSAGLTVSCDLNFRKKLWRWDASKKPRELAEATMRQVLGYVDVLVANEEDCSDVLGIRAGETSVESGKLDLDRYPEVAAAVVSQFPKIGSVAVTLRESISASHNNWGAMLYDAGSRTALFSPLREGQYRPYEIRQIVDRVGAGDSFAAGLIFAFCTPELSSPQQALDFAAAASCLAHSIVGDFNFSSRGEIEALVGGAVSGRVVR
ncbi:MAG: PfkB family carbohydrate kinase [Planctomycetota bacterium]